MISNKLAIIDLQSQLLGKTVLMRVDFNVPLKEGVVTDRTRIVATIPTIKFALDNGAKSIVLVSHAGRPNGCVNMKYSLKPVVPILEELCGKKVVFGEDCVGEKIEKLCLEADGGQIILLENLRFHLAEEGKGVNEKGEKLKASDEEVKNFRDSLTRLGDIFINDAFGTAHRAHSSMVGVNLPIRAAGLLMKKELLFFGKALESPKKPFLAILGGAKVADKIQLIKNLLDRVDMMIITGGMAFTFKKVLGGMKIGNSLFDEEGSKVVKEVMEIVEKKKIKLLLPSDFVIADKFAADANARVVKDKDGIPDGWLGLDIGPESVNEARNMILSASTVIWNGPAGVFEMEKFSQGSKGLVSAITIATESGATTIIGGGDTASLFEQFNASSKVSHVSTGGGASLELLEGKILPGVTYLSDK